MTAIYALNEKQSADYERLRAFYPYRLFFLVKPYGESEFTVWCLRDRRAVNDCLRKGGEAMEITR